MRRWWKGLIAGTGIVVVVAAATSAIPTAAVINSPIPLGSVRWANAVSPSRGAAVVTVDALVEHLDDRGGCGFIVKPHVVETAARVAIQVRVFKRPLPANVACAGSALRAVTTMVKLKSALGHRALIDEADSSLHPVLVVDQTPTLTAIAAPYRRKATSWDESGGRVGEWWRWQTRGQSSQIDLEFGPVATRTRYSSPPSDAHHSTVGSAPALVWTERTGDLLTSTVSWTDGPGRIVRLTLLDESDHPLGERALIEIANSLK